MTRTRSRLDHIAVVAPSLEEGVDFVRRTLGVAPQAGGEHPRMGTHNCVLKLGQRLYLEVIAVNPAAPAPGRARWFELDAPDADRPIRLAAWIARTEDIGAAAAASPVPLGNIEAMSRGMLNWRITVPPDGKPALEGVAPALIQWPPGVHPADTMPDSGCSLVRLEGFHPDPAMVNGVLAAIGFEGDFRVMALPPGERPYLLAHIRTPTGLRQLSSAEPPKDPYELQRFLDAQEASYPQALAELRAGRKRSHWSWYILPQLRGLGSSPMSVRYAIRSRAEARAYLGHPVLGTRLRECVAAMNAHAGAAASEVLGDIDARKFQSCLTLFAQVAGPASVFGDALKKYFSGEPDGTTLALLAGEERPGGGT